VLTALWEEQQTVGARMLSFHVTPLSERFQNKLFRSYCIKAFKLSAAQTRPL